jgi:chitin disaccharide deacetylase
MIRRMAKLIINADDLGTGNATDRAIFETFDSGVVTSASLLVNGRSACRAATSALERNLPVGVHINLSEGNPLSGPIDGLTEADGSFAGKHKTRRKLHALTLDHFALRREIQAQIQVVFDWGLKPDHLDSHQHVFLFPGVTEAIIAVARQFEINALRLPLPYLLGRSPEPDLQQELDLYQNLAPVAAEKFRAAGLCSPQGLFGLDCLNNLNRNLLAELLGAVPSEGCWELMVHPGHLDPDNPFSGPKRELEWQVLTDGKISDLIRELNIELISFGGLPCAS